MLTDKTTEGNDSFITFFGETGASKHVPMTESGDLEPKVINQVCTNTNNQFFYREQFIMGKEEATSGFAHGHCTIAKKITNLILDQIHKLVEWCTSLQGFLVSHSCDRETGFEFIFLLMNHHSSDDSKKFRVEFIN